MNYAPRRLALALLIALAVMDTLGAADVRLGGLPALYESPVLVFDASPSRSEMRVTLRRQADDVLIVDDITNNVLARRSVGATRGVVVNGLSRAHNDALTVDLRGDLRLADGVMFDAGVDGFDTLSIAHDPATDVHYVYEDDDARGHRGAVIVDGTVIRYSGIEPLTNSGNAINTIFTLPDSGVMAQLQDDGVPGNGFVRIAGSGFEVTTFPVPSSMLTVNGGESPDQIIVEASFATDFKSSLTINESGDSADTIQLTALTLGNAGANNGNLMVAGNTISVPGAINTSQGGTGTVFLEGAITLSNNIISKGSIVLAGVLNLVGSRTLTSAASGAITINGAVEGGGGLAITTAGVTNLNGPIGATTALASLTTDAAGTTNLGAPLIRTTGPQIFSDPIALTTAVTLTSTSNADVSFNSTINGHFDLTVNTAGTTSFLAPVGQSTPLLNVTTDPVGLTRLLGGVNTTASQTYGDAMQLLSGVSLMSSGGGVISLTQIDNPQSLTINTFGTTMFNGPVGTMSPLTTLMVEASGTIIFASPFIITAGSQIYAAPAILEAAVTLMSLSNGDITFSTTLNGSFPLTVNTGGGTNFFGEVGAFMRLASLTTNGPGVTRLAGSVSTTGAQTYGDPIQLLQPVTLWSLFAGTIAIAQVDNSFPLTIDTGGDAIFNGPAGSGQPLASLMTIPGGRTIVNGSITTQGPQTYGDAVLMTAPLNVTSTFNAPITFANGIDGPFPANVATGGNTVFIGAIGGAVPLASLTVPAPGDTYVNANITTSGAQDYFENVTLIGNVTLTGTNISLTGAVNGPFALAINASGVTSLVTIGGITPLASLTTNAAGSTTIASGVATSGTQSYGDPVALGGPTVFTSAGPITFFGQVSGGGSLTKRGLGTLTLPGANTYSGGTGVEEGILMLSNSSGSATGPGSVIVFGGVLAGSGTASGPVTMALNSVLSPGNSGIGTLSMGNLVWGGSVSCVSTASFGLSVPNSSDRLIAGQLLKNFPDPRKYRFDFQGTGQTGVYTLASFLSTTFSAGDFTLTNLPAGLGGLFSIVGGNTLQLTVGPSVGHPANFQATRTSPTAISLAWTTDSAFDHYEIWRTNGGAFELFQLLTGTAYTDTTFVAQTVHAYKVRAVDCTGVATEFSNIDIAATFTFADEPLVAGTIIQAVHVMQLRQAIAALWSVAGLGTPAFTDASLTGVPIKLVHITEMRAAVDNARKALGLPAGTYAPITPGSVVVATTLMEIRNALK